MDGARRRKEKGGEGITERERGRGNEERIERARVWADDGDDDDDDGDGGRVGERWVERARLSGV